MQFFIRNARLEGNGHLTKDWVLRTRVMKVETRGVETLRATSNEKQRLTECPVETLRAMSDEKQRQT